MATNVSQQDETLHKVIEWCEQREVEGLRLANALLQKHDLAAYAVVKAQIDAYHKTAEHCRSMLGYSGSNVHVDISLQAGSATPHSQAGSGKNSWTSTRGRIRNERVSACS